jgi:GntR family transcriptional repressor for pyruvate dehydrogenase complex
VKAADSQAAIISLEAMLSRGSDSLRHLTEVRLPLELEIAGWAAERATDEQLAVLDAANRTLSEARDLEAAIDADIAFHRALATATNNPLFVLLLETVAQLSRESRRRTLTTSGILFAHKEHVRIYETVKKRNPTAARAAMQEHLRLVERDLVAAEETNHS